MLVLNWHFFFNDTATTEIYTLSLHDALPICEVGGVVQREGDDGGREIGQAHADHGHEGQREVDEQHLQHRSEEHTSELQSHLNLVCRLLLEKKRSWFGRLTSSLTVQSSR